MSDAPFPDGCSGAVSLTFDDGMASQLDVAIPMLNRHGLRGTFYVNPRGSSPTADDWREPLARWREPSAQGHEVGNHSLTHPCSRAFCDVAGARGLEDMTIADIEADLDEAERRLCEVLGPGPRSFAYPCYNDFVGEGPTRQSYVPVVAKRFIAGRVRGEFGNAPATCSLSHLWSLASERMNADEMVGLASNAALQKRWVIFTFHGIDCGHLPISGFDLERLCTWLAQPGNGVWTAPVAEVAASILRWRGER